MEDFAQDADFAEQIETAVDCGFGTLRSNTAHFHEEPVGVEMFMRAHDGLEDFAAFAGVLQAAPFKAAFKDGLGRFGTSGGYIMQYVLFSHLRLQRPREAVAAVPFGSFQAHTAHQHTGSKFKVQGSKFKGRNSHKTCWSYGPMGL